MDRRSVLAAARLGRRRRGRAPTQAELAMMAGQPASFDDDPLAPRRSRHPRSTGVMFPGGRIDAQRNCLERRTRCRRTSRPRMTASSPITPCVMPGRQNDVTSPATAPNVVPPAVSMPSVPAPWCWRRGASHRSVPPISLASLDLRATPAAGHAEPRFCYPCAHSQAEALSVRILTSVGIEASSPRSAKRSVCSDSPPCSRCT
jgi:hypothetical protein